MLYPHAWIRYATSKLFGILFASCSVEEAVSVLEDENKTTSSKACCQFFIDSGRLERVNIDCTFKNRLCIPIITIFHCWLVCSYARLSLYVLCVTHTFLFFVQVKELQEAFIKQLKSPILSNELGSQVRHFSQICATKICNIIVLNSSSYFLSDCQEPSLHCTSFALFKSQEPNGSFRAVGETLTSNG